MEKAGTEEIRSSKRMRVFRCNSVQSCRITSAVVTIADICAYLSRVAIGLSPACLLIAHSAHRVPAADGKRSQVIRFCHELSKCAPLIAPVASHGRDVFALQYRPTSRSRL